RSATTRSPTATLPRTGSRSTPTTWRPTRGRSRRTWPRGRRRASGRGLADGRSRQAPGEDAGGRDLDDHGGGPGQRGLLRVLRVLVVERLAGAGELGPALDQARPALDHHALQAGPVVGVVVDRDRDPGIRPHVPDLGAVLARADVELLADHRVTDGNEVR